LAERQPLAMNEETDTGWDEKRLVCPSGMCKCHDVTSPTLSWPRFCLQPEEAKTAHSASNFKSNITLFKKSC
jgi:hypothetical protein